MNEICRISGNPGLKGAGYVIIAVIVCLFILPSMVHAAPIPGSLIVSSDPTGARIYLDGAYKGTTTYADKIDPGHYALKLTYPGYQSYETTIAILSNEETNINEEMVKIPTTGTLTAASTPSGAKVYIDGSYEGNTPFSGSLSPGTYDIKVTMVGYKDHITTATIVAGEETMLSFWMYPVETTGMLLVSSTPSGAAVYVDEIYAGSAPVMQETGAGTHTVTVSMSGYNDHISSVSVPVGGTASVNAVLIPVSSVTPATVVSTVSTVTTSPSSAGDGSYVISSTPGGARVYIDGSVMGTTPMRTGDLSSGQHAIMLKLSGYHDYSTVINVVSGTAGVVDADMIPTGAATPAPTYALPGFGWVLALGAVISVVYAGFSLKK